MQLFEVKGADAAKLSDGFKKPACRTTIHPRRDGVATPPRQVVLYHLANRQACRRTRANLWPNAGFHRMGLAEARILRQAQDERISFKTDTWLIE